MKTTTDENTNRKKVYISNLVLAAVTTKPVVIGFGIVARALGLSSLLLRLWGPNTTMVLNPWHPKHVVSLASWVFQVICLVDIMSQKCSYRLGSVKLHYLFLMNFFTSRPTLHMENQLSRWALNL